MCNTQSTFIVIAQKCSVMKIFVVFKDAQIIWNSTIQRPTTNRDPLVFMSIVTALCELCRILLVYYTQLPVTEISIWFSASSLGYRIKYLTAFCSVEHFLRRMAYKTLPVVLLLSFCLSCTALF